MCSPEGGYTSTGPGKEAFQRRVNLDVQKQWTGLAGGRGEPVREEVMYLGCDHPP